MENAPELHKTVEIVDLLLLMVLECGAYLESNPTRKGR